MRRAEPTDRTGGTPARACTEAKFRVLGEFGFDAPLVAVRAGGVRCPRDHLRPGAPSGRREERSRR